MDVRQYLQHVIQPTLERIGLDSLAAQQLLLGTALHESQDLRYIKQVGGPALSFLQIEPATHYDVWENYLRHRNDLRARVMMTRSWVHMNQAGKSYEELLWNMAYAVAIGRVIYLRAPQPLPRAGDIEGQARYYKRFWNTELGKATEQDYIDAVERARQSGLRGAWL